MREASIAIAESRIEDIRMRIANAPQSVFPDDDSGWTYGVDARWLERLRSHWLESYDWRAAEAWLNRFPAYSAYIDGTDIHYFVIKAEGIRRAAVPLVLTHGWPGSVVEFMEAAPLLARQGFDVVIPSLPGYGFSGQPPRPIGPNAVAGMWRTLMTDVLGYKRFAAQGGDWGSFVTAALGREHADVVGAIHLNMYQHRPTREMSVEVAEYVERLKSLLAQDGAYAAIQGTRPQTIGIALGDTPLGFAGWICEKCRAWSDCGGDVESVFSLDQLITNAMTYLTTGNVQTSVWMYRGFGMESQNPARIAVRTGFAEYPAEFIPPPPRSAMEADMNLVHWNTMPSGGHFAAWEQPEAFAEEVGFFFQKWF